MSPHTVRAYLGDVTAMLLHASVHGCAEPSDIDIRVLRSWLAEQHAAGQARSSIARRAAAARAFTAFGHTRGWLPTDPGRLLGTPKISRHLPQVLAKEQMAAVLASRGARRDRDAQLADRSDREVRSGRTSGTDRDDETGQADPAAPAVGAPAADDRGPGGLAAEDPAPDDVAVGGPAPADPVTRAVDLRDTAIMELLYASAIRVSELCGLDLGDLDEDRRTIRVLGKGGKERVVPVGIPALRAVREWLRDGRAVLVGPAQRAGDVPGGARRPDRPSDSAPGGAPADRGGWLGSGHGAARAAAYGGHSPAGGRRRPAQRPGDAGPRVAGDHADLHARQRRAAASGLPPGPSPRLISGYLPAMITLDPCLARQPPSAVLWSPWRRPDPAWLHVD